MTSFLHPESEFLRKIIGIIEENISNEEFGVSELAEKTNMSRSNLLRKVKKLSGLSVSVFIRQVRLYNAREMLKDDSVTVSEIAYRVGFNSTSYFTKCFREEFGYTPGEGKKVVEEKFDKPAKRENSVRKMGIVAAFILVAVIAVIYIYKFTDRGEPKVSYPEKTIAVLPFKNDSSDSTNIYFVNGLMEAILDNLQKIEDMEVTSRTSVEKYRGQTRTIPELSKELDVNYFVEGSGQKIGNRILLTIQLIDARKDKHIWSKRYERELEDIFSLQAEVARNIAFEIEAVITPVEEQRLEKIPTDNMVAYDYYLKGLEYTKAETSEGLEKALKNFRLAIEGDGRFAQAYAYVAICYYYMDIFQADKQYGLEINENADKALLYDSEAPESLIAKALFYMQDEQFELAVEYFEKVLEISPNSGWVHNFLSDIYASYIPNTEEYMSHAIQGIRAAIGEQDSATASITYLHLSNALAQTGFLKEAKTYVKKSLDYNPDNSYAVYLSIYIDLGETLDYEAGKKALLALLDEYPDRVDILQEAGKLYYFTKDYEESWKYYARFIALRERYNLDIYQPEDLKIGFVLENLGRKDEAQKYYDSFLEFARNDDSIYRNLSMGAYYAVTGDVEQGMANMKKMTDEENYIYWLVLFLDDDPILSMLSGHPDYQSTVESIKSNFWQEHDKMRKKLEAEGVI
ncbi:helix-turn-helix domain-containing protein [Fulvivirga sedimenti]|uniref:Helix-turn-helix domain-containing protein n=1 Tax=Fulvivirga sedimenti TaxID=2879465 RepID=A0A9X1HXM7_9BACT|nr:helix-turn-helix domain-containing protein [Fulvivirga sedimenti]MCA6078923.1 helix-turn-helix domain-containing protein [Fulvivirga sedimenti]